MKKFFRLLAISAIAISMFISNCIGVLALEDNSNRIDINRMRSMKNISTLGLHEQNILILSESGIGDSIINNMDDTRIDRMLENAWSIQTQVVYLKTDAEGNTTEINEIEYNMDTVTNNTQRSSNDKQQVMESDDDYMRITVTCVYLDPSTQNGEKGWYMIYTWYEWLTAPSQRELDAFSIASEEFDWSRATSYYAAGYYTAYEANDRLVTFPLGSKTTTDLTKNGNGYFYTWDIPNADGLDMNYVQFYTHVKCRTYNYDTYHEINVFAKYIHHISSISTHNYVWTDSKSSMGVDIKGALIRSIYFLELNHSYDPAE